ncbi:MAG: penicillin-binding protein 2 [Acidimicrobiales bacterium]
MTRDNPRLRLGILGIVAVSLFAALFARLWYLQVLATSEFQLQAQANQQRVIIEPAPRGRIFDRDGTVLVDNRLAWVVSLDRRALAELDAEERETLLGQLVAELQSYAPGLTVDVLEQRLESNRFSPYTPVPVAEDVPEALAVFLTEHSQSFAGGRVVRVEQRAIRSYPFGRTASHVLGYVGAINDEEFAAREGSPLLYQLTDQIGKSGVEQGYEDQLRGMPGRRVLEVDSQGRTVRELEYTPPRPGNDVYLTLNARVQAVAERALVEELDRARNRRGRTPQNAPAGSVVVLDPVDGSVVAMASYPDYDPAAFTDGIDDAEWAALNAPENHFPLVNRALQGQYAPGSTFKLITAYAALSSGIITPETTVGDGGSYRIPNCSGSTCTFRNAGSRSYGNVDLRRALTVSSDVYFYRLGAQFWFQRETLGDPIQEAAELFGLGERSGIPLPSEQRGWVPNPERRAERHEENPTAFPEGRWFAGDNVNLAIGQGEMAVTPIQLANAYAVLANGGTLYEPQVVLRVQPPGEVDVVEETAPQVVRDVELPQEWRQPILDGLTGVTTSSEGTAHFVFGDFPNWTIAGKTGTAEINNRADTALFVGFGPVAEPRYVATAILEESGFGGVAAAPLVERILEVVADPTLMPDLAPGGVLTAPIPDSEDPLAGGDVLD